MSRKLQRKASVLWIVAGWLLACEARAQDEFNLRRFTDGDGLLNSAVRSVTVGSRGTVWLSHDDTSEITQFDGYSFNSFSYPGASLSRIFESQSGQLWAADKEGILVHSGVKWRRYPQPDIQLEHRRNPRRVTHPLSLIPLELNRALILLSNRLTLFDAKENRLTLLKPVTETGLEVFHDMIALADDTVLVTGENGVIRSRQAAKDLKQNSEWLPIPNPPGLRQFRRPKINRDGSVTMVAVGDDNARHIADWDGQRWRTRTIGRHKIRDAWKQSGTGWWGQSYNSIYRIDEDWIGSVDHNQVSAGLFMDVAILAPDTFLVASTEGLLRHAPRCWQKPENIDASTPTHAILEDGKGRLWFLASDGLRLRQETGWRRFPWPKETELLFRATDMIVELDNGKLLIGNRDVPLCFDPESENFVSFEPAGGGQILRLLGQNKKRQPIVWWQAESREPTPGSIGIVSDQSIQPYRPLVGLPIDPERLLFVFETNSGETWFCDQVGLATIENQAIRRYGFSHGLPPESATCLFELNNGLIWVGIGSQLYEYDNKQWKKIYAAQDRINRISQTADGNIWVASNQGLHCYRDDSWITLDSRDGLAANAVYSMSEDTRGRFWTATSHGINRYRPEADIDPPRSQIILRNDPDSSASRQAMFEARDKWNFTSRDRLLFSWRLDQGSWSPYSVKNTLILDNLAAGQHRLEVRAMDRNWNEEPVASVQVFRWVVPWHQDPRLLVISLAGFSIIALLAGLAINRHIRLTRSYAEVEKIVRVRTAELEAANRELLHSQKMRALGAISAGIAHDFNGILSVVRGSAQIIEANMTDRKKVLIRLQRIRLVVDQGASVIRAMLGMAQQEEKQTVETKIIDVVQTTIQIMGDRLPKNITIENHTAPELESIEINPDLLQQILSNLLTNAAEAMANAGTITVESGQANRPPETLVLKPGTARSYQYVAVKDTGCGIIPEALPRIFEPFFSYKSLSSRRGTGLGLFMIYQMAIELNAGLAVDSTVGKGSRFTVYLPVGSFGKRTIPKLPETSPVSPTKTAEPIESDPSR